MLKSFKIFENDIEFSNGVNKDIPGITTRDTIVFKKEDEKTYPYRKYKDTYTHGLISHAIFHMSVIGKNLKREFLLKAQNIVNNYEGEKYILDVKSNIKKMVSPCKNYYEIVNTLDLINDKEKNNMELLPIEKKLYDEIITPIALEYKKKIQFIFEKSEFMKSEDDFYNLNYIKFKDYRGNSLQINYLDLIQGIIVIYSEEKQKIVSSYKIMLSPDRSKLLEYFKNRYNNNPYKKLDDPILKILIGLK